MSDFTKRDMRFFDVAKAIARTSKHERFAVGATLVSGGQVISVGVNTNKSHPVQKKYNKYRNIDKPMHHNLHAEIAAILEALHKLDDLKNVKVYVYRETKDGKVAMARPCPACMACLTDNGVRDIYYTTDIGYAYEHVAKKDK